MLAEILPFAETVPVDPPILSGLAEPRDATDRILLDLAIGSAADVLVCGDALCQSSDHSMITTVTLDDDLVARAHELSGLSERSQLLRQALVALVERESARRLPPSAAASPHCRRSPAAVWEPLDPGGYLRVSGPPPRGGACSGGRPGEAGSCHPSLGDR